MFYSWSLNGPPKIFLGSSLANIHKFKNCSVRGQVSSNSLYMVHTKNCKDLHINLRNFQGKMEFKDFSRTSPKIQGLLKTV